MFQLLFFKRQQKIRGFSDLRVLFCTAPWSFFLKHMLESPWFMHVYNLKITPTSSEKWHVLHCNSRERLIKPFQIQLPLYTEPSEPWLWEKVSTLVTFHFAPGSQVESTVQHSLPQEKRTGVLTGCKTNDLGNYNRFSEHFRTFWYLYSFVFGEIRTCYLYPRKSIGHAFWANQTNILPCCGEIMKHLKLTKKQIATLNYPHWDELLLEVATKIYRFITCHHEIQEDFWALRDSFSVWTLKRNLVTSILLSSFNPCELRQQHPDTTWTMKSV